jgi:hypothetical protein
MFHTNFLQDNQSYLVADYDLSSLTVGVLVFEKRKPKLIHSIRTFFAPDERGFHPHLFERNFKQAYNQLAEKVSEMPKEVCMFLDHGDTLATSVSYTFPRSHTADPVDVSEINTYASELLKQADHQAKKIWTDDMGYFEHDRKLLSLFLTHLALDKKHHLFPIGKIASHITLGCLFFYGNKFLIDGIRRSIELCGCTLLTCVPLPVVFLNHLCTQKTFQENHLHLHIGYDTTSALLHIGKKVHEIQSIPFGWRVLDEYLTPYLSPLERESILMRDDDAELKKYEEYNQYSQLLEASLQVLFERFGLHWSFSHMSLSSQGPLHLVHDLVRESKLSPWIQKNATFSRLQVDPVNHWLHYCDTLDPLFSVHPHPLLALVRSVFIPTHEDI